MKLQVHHWLFSISLLLILVSSVFYHYTSDAFDHRQKAIDDISQAIAKALQQQDSYMTRVAENFAEGSTKLLKEPSAQFPTFVFQSGKLISWSDHQFVPAYDKMAGDYDLKVLKTDDALFIAKRNQLDSRGSMVELFSIIVLQREYSVENRYISSGVIEKVVPYANQVKIILDEAVGHPLYGDGAYLFSIELVSGFDKNTKTYLQVSYILLIIAFLAFCGALFQLFGSQVARRGFWGMFFSFTVSLLLLRLALLFFGFPQRIWDTRLFNPRNYYQDLLHPSLGDLALNYIVLLFLAWFVVRLMRHIRSMVKYGQLPMAMRVVIGAFLVFLGLYALGNQQMLIMNFAKFSQIPIDISQSFSTDVLRIVAYLVLLMAVLLFFITNHIMLVLFGKNRMKIPELILIFFAGYLAYYVLQMDSPIWWAAMVLHLVYAGAMYFTGWIYSLNRIRYISYLYFFSCAIVSAVIVAMAIYQAYDYKTLIKKQKFANQLLLENDILAEYLMHESVESIKNDVQLKSRFITPQFVNKPLFDRIKRTHIHSYLDKYEITIMYFDAEGKPVGQAASDNNLEELVGSFQKPEYSTEFPEIFFVNDAIHFDLSRYYVFVPLERYEIPLGHMVITLQLKMYMPSSVYPELLVDKRFAYTPDEVFNYGMYRNGQFIYEAGSYNYALDFDVQLLEQENFYVNGISDGAAHHLGVHGAEGKVFVITSPVYPNDSILSNFSFVFQLLLLLVALLSLFNAIDLHFKDVHLNFATRLQLYLSIAMFLPLLFISLAILNSLNKSYSEETEKGYRKKADNISRNLLTELKDYLDNKINREQLSQTISDISRYSQSDINLYDAAGKLIATSQPLVFESNLVSVYINPQPFYQIISGEEEALTYDENIGSLAYRSTYEAMRSFEEGKLLGVLSIPFFQSRSYLERQKIEVFNSIINIVTFIFLASFILTNLATTVLTRPLNLIAQKLRKTRLEGENQPLLWNSNDEIGILVTEYNKMLLNLEKSRESLSQTEKEMAWREMARQVAHEIKNPLTPMKLTLQQLQRTLSERRDDPGNNVDRSIKIVLQQIDTLSDIATSFSAFAQMPIPENMEMDLVEVVKDTLLLFHEGSKIENDLINLPVRVFADPKLIGRILNNLLLNSIQSVPMGRQPKIKVGLTVVEGFARVEVKDNGAGIPEDIQSKIFIPNFSTKTAGTGLGLAIAKRGIEHAGGKIWFETEEGIGTTFYFELPIVDG